MRIDGWSSTFGLWTEGGVHFCPGTPKATNERDLLLFVYFIAILVTYRRKTNECRQHKTAIGYQTGLLQRAIKHKSPCLPIYCTSGNCKHEQTRRGLHQALERYLSAFRYMIGIRNNTAMCDDRKFLNPGFFPSSWFPFRCTKYLERDSDQTHGANPRVYRV